MVANYIKRNIPKILLELENIEYMVINFVYPSGPDPMIETYIGGKEEMFLLCLFLTFCTFPQDSYEKKVSWLSNL